MNLETIAAPYSLGSTLPQPAGPGARLLVPIDGSPTAEAAVGAVIGLAKSLNGVIRFVHVADPRELVFDSAHGHKTMASLMKAQRASGESILHRAVERGRAGGIHCDSALLFDPPARVSDLLIRAVETWRATHVVIGTHARRGLDRVLMGSTAHALLLGTSVPVLMIPPGSQC